MSTEDLNNIIDFPDQAGKRLIEELCAIIKQDGERRVFMALASIELHKLKATGEERYKLSSECLTAAMGAYPEGRED